MMIELHFTVLQQTPTNFLVQGYLQMLIIVQLVKTFAAPTEPKLKRKSYVELYNKTLTSALITLPLRDIFQCYSHVCTKVSEPISSAKVFRPTFYMHSSFSRFFNCSLFDLMSLAMAREMYEF